MAIMSQFQLNTILLTISKRLDAIAWDGNPCLPKDRCMGITLKDVIRSDKSDISLGQWQIGHVPYASFPLSRTKKPYNFGQSYKWRLIRFSALGRQFRVLIIYNAGKQIFRSTLGMEKDKDIVILCNHEYHAGEPGWHCHLTTDDSDGVDCGIRKPRQLKRWPKFGSESQMVFHVNEANAVTIVANRYRFQAQGGFL